MMPGGADRLQRCGAGSSIRARWSATLTGSGSTLRSASQSAAFRLLAVFRDPFAFGAEGVVDRADQRRIFGSELTGRQIRGVVDLEFEVAAFQEDVVRLVVEPGDIDAGTPHRPGVDLAGGERRRRVRRIEIDELDLGAIDLVLLERGDEQEFAEARAIDGDRFADQVLDLVDAGIVARDDRRDGGEGLLGVQLVASRGVPGQD